MKSFVLPLVAATTIMTSAAYASEPISEKSFLLTEVPPRDRVLFTIVEKKPEERKREADRMRRDSVREGINRARQKLPRQRDAYDKAESIYRDIKWNMEKGKRKGKEILDI